MGQAAPHLLPGEQGMGPGRRGIQNQIMPLMAGIDLQAHRALAQIDDLLHPPAADPVIQLVG